MYLILVPGQVVRFICLSNKNWKRDKSESEAWKIGAEISAVPYASVLRRVILLVFLAVAGELIWLMLVSLRSSSKIVGSAFKDSLAVAFFPVFRSGVQGFSSGAVGSSPPSWN